MAHHTRANAHAQSEPRPDPDQTQPRTNAERADPSRTKGIREEYAADVYKRLRKLKGVVRTTVEENDALRLGDPARRDWGRSRNRGRPADVLRQNASPRDDFRFETRADKESAFLDWFRGALEDEVLEPVGTETVKRGGHWSSAYVRAASRRGIKNANAALGSGAAEFGEEALEQAFNAPVHQDLLRSLYTRNYRGLKGITDAVDSDVSRVLTEGMVEGVNPRDMAAEINDRIEKVGITRARTLARTETVRAAAEQTLTRYEQMGVEQVVGKVEWLATMDGRTCPTCAALHGTTYTIDEARGRIPQHPNCRCTWTPVTSP
jgi:SPP1 gp7 family putative phage head morphogenesis protein